MKAFILGTATAGSGLVINYFISGKVKSWSAWLALWIFFILGWHIALYDKKKTKTRN